LLYTDKVITALIPSANDPRATAQIAMIRNIQPYAKALRRGRPSLQAEFESRAIG
jgi:hypothetical protein